MSDPTQQPALRTNSTAPLANGTVLDGVYELLALIGEGTFAWVYRARTLGRVGGDAEGGVEHEPIHAIKVLKPEYVSDPEIRRRFETESETLAKLRGRHTVRVHGYGLADSGHPYIVMELLDGISLREMITRMGRMSVLQTAQVTLDVLDALHDAHGVGVVHRDLKPTNIMLVQELGSSPTEPSRTVAKVLDFGIAKVLAGDNDGNVDPNHTAIGTFLCSPRYAAPETLVGAPSVQSDLYSLAHIMVEMLDGMPPYDVDNHLIVIASHLGPDPVPMGATSRRGALASVVAKAAQKQRRDRYVDADEMKRAVIKVVKELGFGLPLTQGFPMATDAGIEPRLPTPASDSGDALDDEQAVFGVHRMGPVLTPSMGGAVLLAASVAVALTFVGASEPAISVPGEPESTHAPSADSPITWQPANAAQAHVQQAQAQAQRHALDVRGANVFELTQRELWSAIPQPNLSYELALANSHLRVDRQAHPARPGQSIFVDDVALYRIEFVAASGARTRLNFGAAPHSVLHTLVAAIGPATGPNDITPPGTDPRVDSDADSGSDLGADERFEFESNDLIDPWNAQ